MDPRVQASIVAEREAGSNARRLMGEMQPYFDALEARLLKVWREDAKTADVREETWHRMKALDMIRADLARLVEGGNLAEKRLAKA